MLVYFKANDDLRVAQVTMSARGNNVQVSDAKRNTMPQDHILMTDKMEKDEIFVSGNASIIGNGRFLDNLFVEITGIKSSHPELFTPVNPDFKPGAEDIQKEYHQKWVSYMGSLEKERADAMRNGQPFKTLDEIDELGNAKGIELNKEKTLLLSKLYSYREMGVIVEPTLIESYGGVELRPAFERYTQKYPPGEHYNKAYHAISADIGICMQDGNGDIVDSGTLSKAQMNRLASEGTPMLLNNFVVGEKEYDRLRGEYLYQKDLYVDEHSLYPRPSGRIESAMGVSDIDEDPSFGQKP